MPYTSLTNHLIMLIQKAFSKTQKTLPLTLLIDYFRLQLIHQFTSNHLPVSFSYTWYLNTIRREDQSGPVLRNEVDYFVPISHLVSTEKHPLVLFPKVWNEFMDLEIKTVSQKNQFNILLKNYYLESLSAGYKSTRLLCPFCHL